MDLRIIIVTWNNRSTIGPCLASLPKACVGVSWEVVLVDNASADGTFEEARAAMHGNGSMRMIANASNRGFAAACNEGLVGFDARYVLFLNPDTQCPQASLAALVREADRHPDAGIIGPKLLNDDGSAQTSIRRFPSFWNQAGILLKLHNLFPGAFRRYFARDLPLNREADVDQVMGACFLIRRDVIHRLGGLDERYFAWFEEVDYCMQVKRAGWKVKYLPSVSVIHGGGHSFAQVFPLKKQRMFNASLISYAEKWFSPAAAASLRVLVPVSNALAWFVGKIGLAGRGSRAVLKREEHRDDDVPAVGTEHPGRPLFVSLVRPHGRNVIVSMAVILILELVSGLTIFNDTWNTIAALAVTLAVAVVSWKRPTLGLAAIALELAIGSKGALLQVGGWPGISIRICMFAAFFLGWAGNVVAAKRISALPGLLLKRREWVFLILAVVYGFVRGFFLHQPFLFADVNAWGFIALVLPVLDLADRDGARLRTDVGAALIAGIVWLGFEALALEYLFSHAFKSIASGLYLWVRRTGVGEVTFVTANAFRIFFQSNIWSMVGTLGAVAWMMGRGREGKRERGGDAVLVACLSALAISLSRSIWIGTFVGLVALGIMFRRAISWRLILRIVTDGIIALALVFTVIAFPVPHVDVASMKNLFGSRLSASDPAAASRWNLLPTIEKKIAEAPILGSGFGAAVTYVSKDPRIIAEGNGGVLTTYAFEWGWLEHWVKMGIFGFLAVAYLVWRLIRRMFASSEPDWIRFAGVSVLVGLAFVHVLTPYLNHPLGFGILFMIEGILSSRAYPLERTAVI